MHDLDPVFDAFSRTPQLAATVASLGCADPGILQSMYIFKPPGIGGEVICHQDSTFLYTEPESCVGFWFTIDDTPWPLDDRNCHYPADNWLQRGDDLPLRGFDRGCW